MLTGSRDSAIGNGCRRMPVRDILAREMVVGGGSSMKSLLGRRRECAEIDRLLADVRAGASRVLVLRGDAGVGKSVLLEYLSEHVGDWRVLSAVGVESEMELAYSGLHQLCSPVLDLLERVPAPQRDALATVFGLSPGAPPDRFLVGLATLTLLAEAAEQHPLICVVDDAQWLDLASAQVLAFVARRLLAERIALVCAARTDSGEEVLAGLPELSIGELGNDDARTLLLGSVYGPLDAAVCDQIITESHGNPLALLELPRTWSIADLAGGFGLPEGRPIADKIEESYLRRLRSLPSDTQLLLLAAAAEPLGDPVLLYRALQALGVDPAAANPAADAGLVQIRGRVEFAHPLVRSATYRAAAAEDRHRVHRALAQATEAEADPDRRAWHRARATAWADEDVAAELERSAGRAQSRGGLAAAAAFLTRAAELTPDPARRVHRALDAAFANLQAGVFGTTRTLLAVAREGPADELQRARIDLLRARLAQTSRPPLLLAAARRLEPLDLKLARETYLDALFSAMSGARFSEGIGVREVVQAARAAPRRPAAEGTTADLLLDGLVALIDDYHTGVPLCREALHRLSSDRISTKERLGWLWQGCIVSLELWDDESAYALSSNSVRIARQTGTLLDLELALSTYTPVLVFCGELSGAAATVAESESVQDATGISALPYGALILAAWRGQEREARGLIESTIHQAGSRREGLGVALGEYTHAVVCNGLGQYEEGLAASSTASDHHEMLAENWGLTELVESATRTGRLDLAADALDRLAIKARASGSDWALGIEARSRALLSDGDSAEALYREAIEHLGRTRIRAELARAHLLYGEWLRREGRRVDARRELNEAHDMFTAMGAAGFAERTRRELLATGATVRKRTLETRDDLTAQEAQIAILARDGLSNPEIAAQLFVSPRTVEWHLGKVFSKLGISRRAQLGVALRDQRRPAAGA
jgi:DNA-binding CsgD family transcriptional regulator